MEQNAHDLYHKHESSILTNIIVFTSLIATSMAGLIVAYRKHTIALIVYAIALDLIYLSSFLYCSRIPAFHCAYIVFVSIIIYIRAYHLHSKRSQTKIRLIQTSNSDAEIIKNAL
ncbi:hypothetical protein NH340_JMT00204 [Sarcoptes scabiei]|nr:hypothetical protein NH340_JMT00204 [Sarcoptes scabiei]